jgi:hypothetical protein
MPQKKKKTNKKTHKKKHLTQNQNIIYQTIPNYSADQFSGHQINKRQVHFGPAMQQESRTDNLVGDLVGRLISKIENDGNKQTQEYSKEIQPINNTNQPVNNNNVNIYNNVPGTTTTDKKNRWNTVIRFKTRIKNTRCNFKRCKKCSKKRRRRFCNTSGRRSCVYSYCRVRYSRNKKQKSDKKFNIKFSKQCPK